MKFLIQTIGSEITLDFCFELLRSFEFCKWRGETVEYKKIELEDLTPDYDGWIPVGTIEIIERYLEVQYHCTTPEKILTPINVPREFIGKESSGFVFEGRPEEVYEYLQSRDLDTVPVYLKTMTSLKDHRNGHLGNALPILDLPEDLVIQVRPEMNILSEWRCFVMDNELVGCQWYSGDFLEFPGRTRIRELVDQWVGPRSLGGYGKTGTLDLAVTLDFGRPGGARSVQTVVMEAHDFYSCGLYGFSDYQKLPGMFSRGWREITSRVRSALLVV